MIGHDHWCFFRENTIDGSARLELQPIAFTPHPNQTQSWPSDTHETRQLAEPTTSSDASQSWPPVLLHGPPVAVRSWPPRGELPAGSGKLAHVRRRGSSGRRKNLVLANPAADELAYACRAPETTADYLDWWPAPERTYVDRVAYVCADT
jgi:hypothetical protein